MMLDILVRIRMIPVENLAYDCGKAATALALVSLVTRSVGTGIHFEKLNPVRPEHLKGKATTHFTKLTKQHFPERGAASIRALPPLQVKASDDPSSYDGW